MSRVQITISQILEDLKNGLTRTRESRGYDPQIGSIQDKYSLDKRSVKALFLHPELKNKKTQKPLDFEIVEETRQPVTIDELDVLREISNDYGELSYW